MDETFYEDYLKFQDKSNSHFFEVGRLNIFQALLDKYIKRANLRILDIGCGNGNMMEYFRKFGDVYGMEMYLPYVETVQKKGFDVRVSMIENWPFQDEKFDIISLFDVLEHIKDDRAALEQIHTALNPGGLVVISVPAFNVLWSFTDIVAHHIRRYTKKELEIKLKNAGFEIVKSTYFNAYLGPLIFLFLLLKRFITFNNAIKTKVNHKYFNYPLINNICRKIFLKETRHLLNKNFSFGTSIFIMAKR